MVAGIAAGGIIPVARAAIGARAPMAERQVMLGRFLVLMIVGQMVGAACSGLVAEHLGWRYVFLMAGAIAGIAGLLVVLVLKPRPDARRAPLSFAGALANYASVFANLRSKPLYGLVIVEGSLIFGMPPYIAAILRELLMSVPSHMREAAYGLGCTQREVVLRIMLPYVRKSAIGAVMLGLGRALGETMAVTFII
eukprot:gene17632-22287_t